MFWQAFPIKNLIIGSLQLRTTSEKEIKFSLYEEDYTFEQLSPGVFRRTSEKAAIPSGRSTTWL